MCLGAGWERVDSWGGGLRRCRQKMCGPGWWCVWVASVCVIEDLMVSYLQKNEK